MKSITFTKTTGETFAVQLMVDIESTIAQIAAAGYEILCTIMEAKGLTESAVKQGLDFTKLTDRSFQDLISIGKAVPVDSIVVTDNITSQSTTLYTRLAIVATDDSVGGVNGTAGASDVLNVLDNDTLGGEAATTSNVTLEEVSNDSAGAVTLNADGSIDVAAATGAGAYTIVYKISEIANPANSDTATATITVV